MIPVHIKTLHGYFEFKVQRFIDRTNDNEVNCTYFDLTNQFQEDNVSDRLREFSAYYSNRLSYSEVAGLVDRVTGVPQLSDQKIRQIVVNKAVAVSQLIQCEIEESIQSETKKFPPVNFPVIGTVGQAGKMNMPIEINWLHSVNALAWRYQPSPSPENLQDQKFPKIASEIDIYNRNSREILVFEDAIQVRGQKENRDIKQDIIKKADE